MHNRLPSCFHSFKAVLPLDACAVTDTVLPFTCARQLLPCKPNARPTVCTLPSPLQRLFHGDPCDDLRAGGQRLLEEPTGAIGLQACRLEVTAAFMGGSPEAPAVFEAGTPWWRA